MFCLGLWAHGQKRRQLQFASQSTLKFDPEIRNTLCSVLYTLVHSFTDHGTQLNFLNVSCFLSCFILQLSIKWILSFRLSHQGTQVLGHTVPISRNWFVSLSLILTMSLSYPVRYSQAEKPPTNRKAYLISYYNYLCVPSHSLWHRKQLTLALEQARSSLKLVGHYIHLQQQRSTGEKTPINQIDRKKIHIFSLSQNSNFFTENVAQDHNF